VGEGGGVRGGEGGEGGREKAVGGGRGGEGGREEGRGKAGLHYLQGERVFLGGGIHPLRLFFY